MGATGVWAERTGSDLSCNNFTLASVLIADYRRDKDKSRDPR